MMFLVEQSTVPVGVLPIAELRNHLLLGSGYADDGAQDAVLEQYLRSAISALEARTGKVLLEKQYSWSLTAWHDQVRQVLPVAPVSSVDALVITDRAGIATTVPSTEYGLQPDEHRPALTSGATILRSIPIGGQAEVTFTAGYGPNWSDVPPGLQQAVLILAAHYYDDRSGAHEFPFGINALIARFRNLRLFGGRRS